MSGPGPYDGFWTESATDRRPTRTADTATPDPWWAAGTDATDAELHTHSAAANAPDRDAEAST